MFKFTALLLFICVLSACAFAPSYRRTISKTQVKALPDFLEKLLNGGKTKDEAKKAAAVKAAPKKEVKDMQWGGRPNPTPEMYVEEPKPKKSKK